MNNPWQDINKGCFRRIDADYDLFWAKDQNSRKLFIIEFHSNSTVDISSIKLSGMEVHLNKEADTHRIILLLKDSDNTEIFYKLCMDIFSLVKSFEDKISPTAIIGRLKRWQNFLSKEKSCTIAVEKQIGLYGELIFLYHKLFDLLGCDAAIEAWVGPDRDKQDFRLNSINVEIKSYLDSKRQAVHISSIEQLNPTNGKLFLYAYGLKINEEGKTIADCAKLVKECLMNKESKFVYEFDELLEKYGYYDCCEYSNLLKLSVFEESIYEIKGEFPKIPIEVKKDAIVNVEYYIDLSLCNTFKIDEKSFNNILIA